MWGTEAAAHEPSPRRQVVAGRVQQAMVAGCVQRAMVAEGARIGWTVVVSAPPRALWASWWRRLASSENRPPHLHLHHPPVCASFHELRFQRTVAADRTAPLPSLEPRRGPPTCFSRAPRQLAQTTHSVLGTDHSGSERRAGRDGCNKSFRVQISPREGRIPYCELPKKNRLVVVYKYMD